MILSKEKVEYADPTKTGLTYRVHSGPITTSAPHTIYSAPKTAPAATSAGPGGNLVSTVVYFLGS